MPAWDEYANDIFAMRLQTIDRFLRIGARLLARQRAGERLVKLQAALKAAGVTDRHSMAGVEDKLRLKIFETGG